MERDEGRHTKLQQLPHSGSFSLAASAWPPPQQVRRPSPSSSHTCGYCKREFRSAQGLGGHMNVHRLDRARLFHHQCSSHRQLALAPPPNRSPSRTVLDLLGSGCPCGRTHGAAASDNDGGSAVPAAKLGICRFSQAPSATAKDFEVKNLELRMGACSHGDDGADERLDLELRIGYS